MGIFFMIIAAICFGWWGLTTVQHYWQESMTSLVAQASQADFTPSTPVTPLKQGQRSALTVVPLAKVEATPLTVFRHGH